MVSFTKRSAFCRYTVKAHGRRPVGKGIQKGADRIADFTQVVKDGRNFTANARHALVKVPEQRVAVCDPFGAVTRKNAHFTFTHQARVDEPEGGILGNHRIGKYLDRHIDSLFREFDLDDLSARNAAYLDAVSGRKRTDGIVGNDKAVPCMVWACRMIEIPGAAACARKNDKNNKRQQVLFDEPRESIHSKTNSDCRNLTNHRHTHPWPSP